MVNSPLIRPYILGGVALGGVPLDSLEVMDSTVSCGSAASQETSLGLVEDDAWLQKRRCLRTLTALIR